MTGAIAILRARIGNRLSVADFARFTGIPEDSMKNYVHRGREAESEQIHKAGRNLIRTGRFMQRIGVALVRSSKRKPPSAQSPHE